jgi:hypothetical protein
MLLPLPAFVMCVPPDRANQTYASNFDMIHDKTRYGTAKK